MARRPTDMVLLREDALLALGGFVTRADARQPFKVILAKAQQYAKDVVEERDITDIIQANPRLLDVVVDAPSHRTAVMTVETLLRQTACAVIIDNALPDLFEIHANQFHQRYLESVLGVYRNALDVIERLNDKVRTESFKQNATAFEQTADDLLGIKTDLAVLLTALTDCDDQDMSARMQSEKNEAKEAVEDIIALIQHDYENVTKNMKQEIVVARHRVTT